MPMERSPERREATQRRARVYGRELRLPRARPTFFDFREFEVEANAESVRSRARARELSTNVNFPRPAGRSRHLGRMNNDSDSKTSSPHARAPGAVTPRSRSRLWSSLPVPPVTRLTSCDPCELCVQRHELWCYTGSRVSCDDSPCVDGCGQALAQSSFLTASVLATAASSMGIVLKLSTAASSPRASPVRSEAPMQHGTR